MKRLLVAAFLMLALPAAAQSPIQGNFNSAVVEGYCELSVTTAVGFSSCLSGLPKDATWAAITNEGGAFRYRIDGGAASTTSGSPVPAGTAAAPTYIAISAQLAKVSLAAQDAGVAAVLKINFMR